MAEPTSSAVDFRYTPGDEHRESSMESVMLARLISSTASLTPPPFFDEDDKSGVQSCLLRRSTEATMSTATPSTQWFRNQFQCSER